jgi:radical SAM protein with 4Fe4S-binding SPASM domain
MKFGTIANIEPTNRCNFQCVFCAPREQRTNKDLDFDQYVYALKKLKDTSINGVYMNTIQLGGHGEPLLYPRIFEMIIEAKKYFDTVEMTTNGYLLTEKAIRTLLETNIDTINISLTGITAEVYSKFQGSGVSEDVCKQRLGQLIENVKTLCELRNKLHKKTYIRLRYIKTDDSKFQINEYCNFWEKHGIDEVWVTSLWNFKREKKFKGKYKVLRCWTVPRKILLAANGEVFPCTCNFDKLRNYMGNIFDTPFEQIITSNNFLQEKKNRMSCNLNVVPKSCLTCEMRALRDFFEEIRYIRNIYFLGKPLKTFLYKIFGPGFIIFERITRIKLFYDIFLFYIKLSSTKTRRDFMKRSDTISEGRG